jgi:hypothetical protein
VYAAIACTIHRRCPANLEHRKKILYDPVSYDPAVDLILHHTHHKLYDDLIIRYGDLLNQRLLLFEIHDERCGPRLGRTTRIRLTN